MAKGRDDVFKILKSNPKDLDAKRVIPLDVAGAFHSPTVTPAKNALETALNDIEINTGTFDVYLNVNAEPAVTLPGPIWYQ